VKRLGLFLVALVALATPAMAQPVFQTPTYAQGGIHIGTGTGAPGQRAHRITKTLAGPVAGTTIDFTAISTGVQFSSAITVTGAVVGDVCSVGAPAAASALNAEFTCVVTAANEVKVKFTPKSFQEGTATLVSGTPSTVVVAGITASSRCLATPVGLTAAIAGAGLAVSLTTTNLTITGPDTVTTVLNYSCAAPVDPAEGAYLVRVFSQQ